MSNLAQAAQHSGTYTILKVNPAKSPSVPCQCGHFVPYMRCQHDNRVKLYRNGTCVLIFNSCTSNHLSEQCSWPQCRRRRARPSDGEKPRPSLRVLISTTPSTSTTAFVPSNHPLCRENQTLSSLPFIPLHPRYCAALSTIKLNLFNSTFQAQPVRVLLWLATFRRHRR
jgi:hypothetical protein